MWSGWAINICKAAHTSVQCGSMGEGPHTPPSLRKRLCRVWFGGCGKNLGFSFLLPTAACSWPFSCCWMLPPPKMSRAVSLNAVVGASETLRMVLRRSWVDGDSLASMCVSVARVFCQPLNSTPHLGKQLLGPHLASQTQLASPLKTHYLLSHLQWAPRLWGCPGLLRHLKTLISNLNRDSKGIIWQVMIWQVFHFLEKRRYAKKKKKSTLDQTAMKEEAPENSPKKLCIAQPNAYSKFCSYLSISIQNTCVHLYHFIFPVKIDSFLFF